MFNLRALWALLRQSMHALRHGLHEHQQNFIVDTLWRIPIHYVAIGCTCGKEFYVADNLTPSEQRLLDSLRSTRNNPNRNH